MNASCDEPARGPDAPPTSQSPVKTCPQPRFIGILQGGGRRAPYGTPVAPDKAYRPDAQRAKNVATIGLRAAPRGARSGAQDGVPERRELDSRDVRLASRRDDR